VRTAAIVVAWHQPEMTIEALRSLCGMEQVPDTIVCVAQELTTAERAAYEQLVPAEVETIFLDENIGFAPSVNLAMDRLAASGADWVLVLNNDAVVTTSCLRECLDVAIGSDRVAAIGPAVMHLDRPDRIWWAGGRLSNRWGITRHPHLDEAIDPLPLSGETQFIPGCCVLYSMAAWRELGGFVDDYFMYYEDAEWCLRARAAGWRLHYIDKPLCLHGVGASSGQRSNAVLSEGAAYFLARNPLRAALDARPASTRLSRTVAVLAIWGGYNLLRVMRSSNPCRVGRAYLAGLADGFRGHMGPRRTTRHAVAGFEKVAAWSASDAGGVA
jgi:GT2 family glycosyltransferase